MAAAAGTIFSPAQVLAESSPRIPFLQCRLISFRFGRNVHHNMPGSEFLTGIQTITMSKPKIPDRQKTGAGFNLFDLQ